MPDLRLRAQSPPAALRIVVIEGENAVNIVSQKTAVAPIVEVRDRNDQPVAGATVRFAIRAGKATFGGPRTLAVTTDGAGRAAATALTPTGSGALQISATAAFQGQTAAVTIAQTNVMTAAAASGAAGAGGASAGAGGGGGGLSTTTVGVIGAGVAGAAVAVNQLTKEAETQSFSASVAGPLVYTFPSFCAGTTTPSTRTETVSGTLRMSLQSADGAVSGTAEFPDATRRVSAQACPEGVAIGTTEGNTFPSAAITGSDGNFTFRFQQGPSGPTSRVDTVSFIGSLANGVVTGTLTWTVAGSLPGSTATGTFSITAR